MKKLGRMAVCAAACGLMLALGSAGGGAQGTGTQTSTPTLQMPPLGPVTPTDARVEKMQKDLAKQENTDRQKKLVADTAKLLELANELKAAVDKSNKDTLSLDVVRKADAIEKLAHSVKEGMKGN
ncbi:MAG TPA: hypothetical protein VMQ60_10510 [Acidobacteriaceae bacterium]|jgi:hypothetical protein|nr:hypothetical protein [Acidobacteriaceae bacterium]